MRERSWRESLAVARSPLHGEYESKVSRVSADRHISVFYVAASLVD